MRLGSDSAGDCNTLLLAAGQLGRVTVYILADLHSSKGILDAAIYLILGQLLDIQTERDVLAHRHMRPQCVGLEYQVEVTFARRREMSLRSVDDFLAVHVNGAVLRLLQAGYYTQRGGFAAAGRAEQRHKVTVFNREVYILQNVVLTVEFINMLQFNFAHFPNSFFPVIPCGSTAHAASPDLRRQRYSPVRIPGIRWRT